MLLKSVQSDISHAFALPLAMNHQLQADLASEQTRTDQIGFCGSKTPYLVYRARLRWVHIWEPNTSAKLKVRAGSR